MAAWKHGFVTKKKDPSNSNVNGFFLGFPPQFNAVTRINFVFSHLFAIFACRRVGDTLVYVLRGFRFICCSLVSDVSWEFEINQVSGIHLLCLCLCMCDILNCPLLVIGRLKIAETCTIGHLQYSQFASSHRYRYSSSVLILLPLYENLFAHRYCQYPSQWNQKTQTSTKYPYGTHSGYQI